ncbi:MAG: YggS family pyridoxal phosphate-dependent enzyme [Chloroflexota bacterium]
MNAIQEKSTAVKAKIAQSARAAGRDPEEITLVSVTKTKPASILIEAYEAGLRHFGENRTHELEEKRPFLEKQLGQDSDITWHFIGNLQSRKAKIVADYADIFHAVDRVKIVNRLQARLLENGRQLSVFIEVNTSGEMSKSGVNCTNLLEDATQQAELRNVVQAIEKSPNLTLLGLMTMAPWGAPEEEIRTVFSKTKQCSDWLRNTMNFKRPLQLSMGMTDDYPIAIAEGATHVRVGRAIFGERN